MLQSAVDIDIRKNPSGRLQQVDFDKLTFGELFSDHMLIMDYRNKTWQKPVIEPYGPLSLSPATKFLHYGQGVFEGLKAFRYAGGKINIFRLDEHYHRMKRSCERMIIPLPDQELFIETIKALVETDRDWVPKDKFKSLYIRPLIFATDESLGMREAQNYKFIVITSPVGNYYKEGIKPVKLTTMPEFVRATPGGAGEAKVPGNYASSLYPGARAFEQGYTQVLWLDAIERRYVEEVGTSNIFFVIEGKLVTPDLSGSILPGITRKSILELAERWSMPVEERKVAIDELFELHKQGKLTEVFGSGTAAVVSPVGVIHHEGKKIELDQVKMGPVAQKFYDTITGIHHGEIKDEAGWCHLI